MQQQVLGLLVTVPVIRLPWPPAARQLSRGWGAMSPLLSVKNRVCVYVCTCTLYAGTL